MATILNQRCSHCGGCLYYEHDEIACLSCGRGPEPEAAKADTGGTTAAPVNEFRTTRRHRYNSPYHGIFPIFPPLPDPDSRRVPA